MRKKIHGSKESIDFCTDLLDLPNGMVPRISSILTDACISECVSHDSHAR